MCYDQQAHSKLSERLWCVHGHRCGCPWAQVWVSVGTDEGVNVGTDKGVSMAQM